MFLFFKSVKKRKIFVWFIFDKLLSFFGKRKANYILLFMTNSNQKKTFPLLHLKDVIFSKRFKKQTDGLRFQHITNRSLSSANCKAPLTMSISILLSSSLTSPLSSISCAVTADEEGNFNTTVICFITGYVGLTQLTIYDEMAEQSYTAHTNEYGSVGFHIKGSLPNGERKKNYPLLITTPNEECRSFLTINAAS